MKIIKCVIFVSYFLALKKKSPIVPAENIEKAKNGGKKNTSRPQRSALIPSFKEADIMVLWNRNIYTN